MIVQKDRIDVTFAKRVSDVFSCEGSDKAGIRHCYERVYAPIFSELSERKGVKVAEVGVSRGGSIRAMQILLDEADIYGIDLDPYSVDGSTTIKGDGYSEDTWKKLPYGFSLIIDDGSNRLSDVMRGMPLFVSHLAVDGIIVIEDIPSTDDAIKILEAYPGGRLYDFSGTGKPGVTDDRVIVFRKTSDTDGRTCFISDAYLDAVSTVVSSMVPVDISGYRACDVGGYTLLSDPTSTADAVVTLCEASKSDFARAFSSFNESCVFVASDGDNSFSHIDSSRVIRKTESGIALLKSASDAYDRIVLYADIDGIYRDDTLSSASFSDMSHISEFILRIRNTVADVYKTADLLSRILEDMVLVSTRDDHNMACSVSGCDIPNDVILSFVSRKYVSASELKTARHNSSVGVVHNFGDIVRISTDRVMGNSFVLSSSPSGYSRFCNRMSASGFSDVPKYVPYPDIRNVHDSCLISALAHYSIVQMASLLDLPCVAVFEDCALPALACRDRVFALLSNGGIPGDADIVILGGIGFIRDYARGGRTSLSVQNDIPGSLFGTVGRPFIGSHAAIYFKRGYAQYISGMASMIAEGRPCADAWDRLATHVYASKENLFLRAHDSIDYRDIVCDQWSFSDFGINQ